MLVLNIGDTADVTRTIPVNGKFNNEQKIIYDLVYKSQEEAIKEAIIGNSFNDIYLKSYDIIAKGLIDLGIINDYREARKYYPHGVSHHIGLDVHDPGSRDLMENMVITVEPGYIFLKTVIQTQNGGILVLELKMIY